jgi:hypothetical protein
MGKPPKKGPYTAANTPTKVYMDTFHKAPECNDPKNNDNQKVKDKCKPKTEHQRKDEKGRKTGLIRVIRQVASKLDKAGQKLYGYDSNKTNVNNEWMDDHCEGMWVKPQFNGADKDADFGKEVEKYKKDLENLGTVTDYYLKNPRKMIERMYEQLAKEAVEKLGYDSVRNMLLNKLGKDALLAAIPTKAGFLGKLLSIGKVGISATGYVDAASTMDAALKSDYGRIHTKMDEQVQGLADAGKAAGGKMSMDDTIDAAVKSHKEAFPASRCSADCIRNQLNSY